MKRWTVANICVIKKVAYEIPEELWDDLPEDDDDCYDFFDKHLSDKILEYSHEISQGPCEMEESWAVTTEDNNVPGSEQCGYEY